MTLDDLIADLEEARGQLGGEAEVRVALQPSYPLRAEVARVTVINDPSPPQAGDGWEVDGDAGMVWIAASSSVSPPENPYAPAGAWTGEPVDA